MVSARPGQNVMGSQHAKVQRTASGIAEKNKLLYRCVYCVYLLLACPTTILNKNHMILKHSVCILSKYVSFFENTIFLWRDIDLKMTDFACVSEGKRDFFNTCVRL